MKSVNVNELKKLATEQVIAPLSKHLNVYEKKAKELVKELDLRSRDAREKSRVRLDELAKQIKKTGAELEAKVKTLLEEEGKRLNQKVNELVENLRATAARPEPAKAEAPKAAAATNGEAKTTKRKKASAPRKPRATKTSSKGDHATTAH